jgi:hypothetical protein
MGAGAYSTNNRVNAAVAAKANARQPVEEVVSLNADPFPTTVPREAKFYSDMTMAERREVDAIRAGTAPSLNLNTYQGIPELDFGVGTQYDNPEEALSGYGDYFSNIQGQRESASQVVNYNQFDPGDFGREGISGPSAYIGKASGESLADYISKNEIPLTKEVDGKTMYLTTGDQNASFRLMPDQFSGGDLIAQGPVGTYSSVFVKDDNLVEGFLKEPIVNLAASFIPGGTLAMTAAKTAAGVKVTPMEIASSMLTGLEMAGVVKPPSLTPMPAGQMGTPLPNAGTGLFGSTYAQTKTALNIAAAGDAKGAALALVNDNLIKDGLDGIGLDQEAIEGAGIQYDDFQAGVGRVVSEVASGTKLDDALVQGLGKYIREGGTLGSIDLPSVDLGIDLGGLSEFIGPIADKLSEVETAVRQGLSEFDKEVLQPSTKPIGDTLSAAETEVRQGLSTLDKEVLQPITQPIGDIVEDVAQVTGDVVEDVGQAVGDVASDLDTAVRQALPNTSIDLPSVDLPNLDFPNLGLNPSLGSTGMLELKYPSATRTTDALFNDELFKFKNKIEPTKERLEYIDLNEPVENFFEDTINERLPRSYMF